MGVPWHKLELKHLLTSDGVEPADIHRIESAGDSGCGRQVVLFSTTEGEAWQALIDRPTNKDKPKVVLTQGWDLP